MAFVNSLVCPSSGTNAGPSFPPPIGLQGQPSRAHLPSLCAGHFTGLARLFSLTWKLREALLPRSPGQPFQNLPIFGLPWLLLPPFVPGNPRALTWASLVLGWSGRLPEGPEAPVSPSPESTQLWETAFSPPATSPGACLHGSTHRAPGAARWPGLQPLEHTCLLHRPQSCLGGRGWGGGGPEFPQGVANNQPWKPNICKIVGGLFKTWDPWPRKVGVAISFF